MSCFTFILGILTYLRKRSIFKRDPFDRQEMFGPKWVISELIEHLLSCGVPARNANKAGVSLKVTSFELHN